MKRAVLPLFLVPFLTCCTHVRPGPDIIPMPVHMNVNPKVPKFFGGNISSELLAPSSHDYELGEEGYELVVNSQAVLIKANSPAGIFYGKQSIKQAIANGGLPAGIIRDFPRFVWRGAMLDVARHFFSVSDVVRYIDLLALYKMNRLHLHLTDDQGWRIEIKSWPRLTEVGSQSAVGGGIGGYFTQDDYRYIVRYAAERFITIIPEVDMPGHVNAALASYPELSCDKTAPPLYVGVKVGFSSLCLRDELTYRFVDDVIREIASITEGPYIHIGGDEAFSTDQIEYAAFITRVESMVRKHNKTMIGWEEILADPLDPSSIAQRWHRRLPIIAHADNRNSVILSPADKMYMDMKYHKRTSFGHRWAGFLNSQTAYEWDPSDHPIDEKIDGIEAPLWTEFIDNMNDVEYMAFPRIMGYAEIAWSSKAGRDWKEYRLRAGAHGPLLRKMKVNYYADPDIHWR